MNDLKFTEMEKIKNMNDFEFHVRVPAGASKEEVLKALTEEVKRMMEFESEDERIRSAMIRGFNSMMANLPVAVFAGEPVKNILAYLEKQKDADKAILAVDRIDRYIDGHVTNAHDMKDSHPEKKYCQGIDAALSDISGILLDVYSEKQKEQKPISQEVFDAAKHEATFGEQQSAEWSEEDEEMLKCIVNVLDRLGFEEFCKSSRDQDVEEERFYYKEIQWLKNRLKSLRPQKKEDLPKWKPSEEQIRALNAIISTGELSYVGQEAPLISLKNELKKL